MFGFDPLRWRTINRVLAISLLIYVLYFLTAFRFVSLLQSQLRQVDFIFYYFVPPLIFEKIQYPTLIPQGWHTDLPFWHVVFPYLPSASAMMLPLSALPQTFAFVIWMLLQVASFYSILFVSLRLSGAATWPSRWLVLAATVAFAGNPISWDLRNHNTNFIYLALALLGLWVRRAWLGGLLIALSFNLKLYSGLIPIGLALWKDYRRLLATIVLSAAVLLIPVLLVGVFGYWELMKAWLDQVLVTTTQTGASIAPPSLRIGIATTLNLDVNSPAVYWIWRSTQFLWVALIVGYFVSIPRSARTATDGRARLADACVLLMTPLPLSTWFEPYHAVVIVPSYILLFSVAADDRWPRRVRLAALFAPMTYQLLHAFIERWEFRSGLFFLSFVFVVLAVAMMRTCTTSPDPSSELHDHQALQSIGA